jgi:hypothetical protein
MYHTVQIRDLSPTPKNEQKHRQSSSEVPHNYWLKDVETSVKNYVFRYSSSNGPHSRASNRGHAVFEAYLAAYNAHEDIVLSPDDIWIMIIIYYGKYVNENAEQMRSLFVDHEGKQKLVVETFSPAGPE